MASNKTRGWAALALALAGALSPASAEAQANAVRTLWYHRPDSAVRDALFHDGLGRPLQQVSAGASPDGLDIVAHREWDARGLEAASFLPFAAAGEGAFREGALGLALGYHASPQRGAAMTAAPFSATAREASPAARPLESGIPGEAFQPGSPLGTTLLWRGANAEPVPHKAYSGAPGAGRLPKAGDFRDTLYAPGSLAVERTTHPGLNGYRPVSETFRDARGRVVMTRVGSPAHGYWEETRAVFDALGRAVAVMPPEAGLDPVGDLSYLYAYDARGRLAEKKLPGMEKTEYVYDRLDRPCLERGGELRARGLWRFTKWDAHGRPVLAGLWRGPGAAECRAMAADGGHSLHEARSGDADGPSWGYTDDAFPSLAGDWAPLSATYHDDHSFLPAGSGLGYAAALPGMPASPADARGLATGARVAAAPDIGLARLPGAGAESFLAARYHDELGRVCQTVAQNAAGGVDRTSLLLDHRGNPVRELLAQGSALGGRADSHQMDTRRRFDARGRLLEERVLLDGAEAWLSRPAYDPLGRPAGHDALGSPAVAESLSRTPQGWLASIAFAGAGQELLRQDFLYQDGAPGMSNTAHTGDISGIRHRWKGGAFEGLEFRYDPAFRLRAAYSGAGQGMSRDGRGDMLYSYDRNGNLRWIQRETASGALADNLTLAYEGNRLASVVERGDPGIWQRGGGKGLFAYDRDGGMVHDPTRGLSFALGLSGLPERVSGFGGLAAVEYRRLADGAAFRTRWLDARGEPVADRIQAGPFTYQDGRIAEAALPRGRALHDGRSWGGVEIFLTDHLGSVRGAADTAGNLLYRRDFTPFGLETNAWDYRAPIAVGKDEPAPPAPTALSYNGKPEQRHPQAPGMDLGMIDYGARFYDPSLGRWHAPDPLAEEYLPASPYAYVENRPVGYIDPNGEYKLPAGFEEEYPRTAAYVRYVAPSLASNSRLERAYRTLNDYEDISVEVTTTRIQEQFVFNQGPTLFATEWTYGGTYFGQAEYREDDDEIRINVDLLNNVEIADTPEGLLMALIVLEKVLIHESAHILSEVSEVLVDPVESDYFEVGNMIESLFYGATNLLDNKSDIAENIKNSMNGKSPEGRKLDLNSILPFRLSPIETWR